MKRTKKTKTSKTGTITTSAYETVGSMANDVRGVLKSIIAKDDTYTIQEASVVSKLYTCELTRMKLQVELHKINNNSNQTPVHEVLSLN